MSQFLCALTSLNINRFSENFFHRQDQEKNCNDTIRSHHTSNVSLFDECDLVKRQRFVDHAIGQWRRRLECVVQQQDEHIKNLVLKLHDVSHVTARKIWCQFLAHPV